MAGLCPGHPRLSASALEDVDARHTAGHDESNGEAEFDVLVLPGERSDTLHESRSHCQHECCGKQAADRQQGPARPRASDDDVTDQELYVSHHSSLVVLRR
jgi:hypothetical protein